MDGKRLGDYSALKQCFGSLLTKSGDVDSVKRILSKSSFDVGQKFHCFMGFSGSVETRTILDEALSLDQFMGKNTYVPLIIKNSLTNFSSTVNLVGWSTLQRVLLHSIVAREVSLFESFCARLNNIELEDRHCHYCGKISEQPLFRCGICRIAVYCDKNCQKLDWKTGPLHSNGFRISHKNLHTAMLQVAELSLWYKELEKQRETTES